MAFIGITEELSLYPLLIKMMVQETGTELALGTGFVYEYEDYYYLITNGHNITGVNPETNTRLSNHAAFPTVIRTQIRVQVSDNGDSKLSTEFRVPIYEDEDYAQPLWFVHPQHRYRVDVVAIPLCSKEAFPKDGSPLPINHYKEFTAEPQVADDVYILGYPFGITDPDKVPIWKRGSIASEPNIPYKNLPMMLVDTATRSGMSGSPVILMRSGVHNAKNGMVTTDTRFGTVLGFVGIYSGRIGAKEENEAQLGIVWRKEVIEQILSSRTLGTTDFQRV
ncbi:conserved hypothetical protein [Hymenobacter roseosalivarius DSM 11622]|uniref:Peptidase S1 and S6 chymotrypsin/Hap n=1 Tax=Hymenobacter roseosalivarius DSM 11622 TaxID=645990 RepID=A0A1W1W4U9_9BACT|nr:serine protease [Hymenobacter roseosalivarius]SMC00647.1 conserved hypothetical protein [Hymenobacter roseosalivarius DSM 11622]